MKRYFYRRNWLAVFIGLFIFAVAPDIFAKTLSLYEQPDANSKVVATVDSDVGVIAIFSPENSNWIKVADPRNGNVGWVKTSDLADSKLSFNIISTDKGKQSFQIIQLGGRQAYTPQKLQETMQQIQLQQQVLQKDVQQITQDMFRGMYREWASYPIIMPIFLTPEKKDLQSNAGNSMQSATENNKNK